MKCECGLTYVPGEPDDERVHAKVHAEYLSDPEISSVRQLDQITTIGDFSIYVIDNTCPMEIRRELSHVAFVAHQTMPDYPAGYDGTITEDDPRLFIAVDGMNVIAMVLTEFDDYFWRLAWKDGCSVELVDTVQLEHRRRYKVARAWTAADYQHNGISSQLIQIASNKLSCNIADFGWELPFTSCGKHLVKRLCPKFFLGCGDFFSLNEALEEKPK